MAKLADLKLDAEAGPGPTHPGASGLKTLKGPLRPAGLTPMQIAVAVTVREAAAPSPGPLAPIVAWEPPPGELSVAQLTAHPFAYLKGPAGTGKTYLARQIIAEREDSILCATTGIAAVNLGDATTINALLGYFDTQSLQENWATGRLSARLRKLRKSGIRLLVLDEVSMLDAGQLSVLCQALDDVNLKKQYDQDLGNVSMVGDDDLEMRLLLVGDFAQLPPVKAPFAFSAPEWDRFAAQTFSLETIRRQGDQDFVRALQAVRRGDAQAALPILEPSFAERMDFTFDGTTIVATNNEVDRINQLRHAGLKGELLSWKTIRSGEQQKEWLTHIPESVDVKVGALVMVLANLSLGWDEESHMPMGYAYVNGDLGVVEGTEEGGLRVKLQRTDTSVLVKPLTSEWKEATGKKNPAFTVKGAVTRMPLRLAYATTVHKSQGLSLDRVQVGISSWMFGKGGVTYVALSRARTLEGLRIVGNAKMFLGKCAVDPRVKGYL